MPVAARPAEAGRAGKTEGDHRGPGVDRTGPDWGEVEPKTATWGRPSAAATCIAPESLLTSSSARASTATRAGRSVRPHQLRMPLLPRADLLGQPLLACRAEQQHREPGFVAQPARQLPVALRGPGLGRAVDCPGRARRTAPAARGRAAPGAPRPSRAPGPAWAEAGGIEIRVEQVEVLALEVNAAPVPRCATAGRSRGREAARGRPKRSVTRLRQAIQAAEKLGGST